MNSIRIGLISGSVVALGAFFADLNLQVGFAAGVLYVLSVALTALDRLAKQIFVVAGVCSLLTVLGYFLSPPGIETAMELTNRALAIFAILVTMVIAWRYTRAEQSVEKTEDLYQAVFNQTFQFVAALDPDGNIIEANQTLRDYAGLSAAEIQSVPLWLLPIFHDDLKIQERIKSHVESARRGNFARDEFSVMGIGDQTTIIDFSLKPIRGRDSTVEQMIMEARDITEARIQQEMLVQAQKMEAVGELTAGVAHDFNNLLTVIVGNLEILQKRLEGNEAAQDRLRRAVEAAFRGQALTQQLLAFSRRQSLNPAVVNVNVLLHGMSQLYEALGDAIEVEFDLDDDLPPCEVDPTLLETALLNIAINARDAMPDGGKLRFETARMDFDQAYRGEITDLPPGVHICLAITDSGSGMSPETLSQVFEPFFTTKREGQGTGLGLSMVYGFVKQSGGDIKIYSEEGKGTTIRIYLPATDKALPETEITKNNGGSDITKRDKRVLLVDDDEAVRDVILNALTDLGCHVETAGSGNEAIEMIRLGKKYDLVFTDMVMTGDAGGPDVARAARAVTPGVPVIFCSGFPRQSLEGEEAAVEGAYFLPKPFEQETLVNVVNRAIKRTQGNPHETC